MSERTNRHPAATSSNPWTPEWLRSMSPSAVVAMAEQRERTEARDAARRAGR
jgi:hypothetical protein